MPSKDQREALLSLLQGAEGKEWGEKMGWIHSSHNTGNSSFDEECDWYGIQCDSTLTYVTAISIEGSGLSASIPSIFCTNLQTLRTIKMDRNMIYGTIPIEITSLNELEILSLSNNILTGTIPTFVSGSGPSKSNTQSHHLKQLMLGGNRLTGTLPNHITGSHDNYISSAIEVLELGPNRLTGTLPSTFFHGMYRLHSLDLSFNRLSGSIPSIVVLRSDIQNHDSDEYDDNISLMHLRYLRLNDNQFVGYIPSGLARVINDEGKDVIAGQGNSLEEIWLQNNNLSGNIPVVLTELDALKHFYVDGNKLTGTIPSEICLSRINYNPKDDTLGFDVDDNDNDNDRDDGYNPCDSILCPTGTTSPRGVHPCYRCDNLRQNPYLGQSGNCRDLGQREILNLFRTSITTTTVSTFTTTNNNNDNISNSNVYEEEKKKKKEEEEKKEGEEDPLSDWRDDVFLCSFTGITCDFHHNIIEINLHGLGLHGTIPPEIGFLEHLEVLDISDNSFTGNIPSDLRWAPLRLLDVSGNKMKGIVPPLLCRSQGLNKNGFDGEYISCDRIACPIGTYSAEWGRKMSNNRGCLPCRSDEISTVLANSKGCLPRDTGDGGSQKNGVATAASYVLLFMVVVCSLVSTMYCVARRRSNRRRANKKSYSEVFFFRDESSNNERNNVTEGLRYNSNAVSSMPYLDNDNNNVPYPHTFPKGMDENLN